MFEVKREIFVRLLKELGFEKEEDIKWSHEVWVFGSMFRVHFNPQNAIHTLASDGHDAYIVMRDKVDVIGFVKALFHAREEWIYSLAADNEDFLDSPDDQPHSKTYAS